MLWERYVSPKSNYWRKSSESFNFMRCPGLSCNGDEYFEKNSSVIDSYLNYSIVGTLNFWSTNPFTYNFTGIGSCAKGYTGALCSECDAEAGFGKSDSFKCSYCSASSEYYYKSIEAILKILLFFYTTWKALKIGIKKNLHKNYTQPDFVNNVQSSFLIKILSQHFIIIFILKTIPIRFNDSIEKFLSLIINLTPNQNYDAFSYECFLRDSEITYRPIEFNYFFMIGFGIFTMFFSVYIEEEPSSNYITLNPN